MTVMQQETGPPMPPEQVLWLFDSLMAFQPQLRLDVAQKLWCMRVAHELSTDCLVARAEGRRGGRGRGNRRPAPYGVRQCLSEQAWKALAL